MESNPKPKNFSDRAEEIGAALGSGERMSQAEKVLYLKKYGNLLRINADFVPVETYIQLFRSLDLNGKTVVNVGAGAAVGDSYRGTSPIIEALDATNADVVCIPIDYTHWKTRSWNLLDTNDASTMSPVELLPVTADATSLPFTDNSVDGYLSTNLINEPRTSESEAVFVQKMLSEAYRVIKPGGFIILSSFGYFWWKTEDGTILFNDSVDAEEIVSVKQIELYLNNAGFTQISPIAIDPNEIHEAIQERLARKKDAVEAGVTDACAFLARK